MEYAWDNIEKELVSDGYQYWKPGQPDNSDEHCMEMMSGNGKWNNLDCNANRFVLCEKCETCTPTTEIPTTTLAPTSKIDSASEFSTKLHKSETEHYDSTQNIEVPTTPNVPGANHLGHHDEDPKTIDDNPEENTIANSNEYKDASTPIGKVDSQQTNEPTDETEKSNVDQIEVKMEENTDYYYNEDPINKETDTYDDTETQESATTIESKIINNSNVESIDDLKMNMLDEDSDNKSAIHQNTVNSKVDVSNNNEVEEDSFDLDESKTKNETDAHDIEEATYMESTINTLMNMEITNGETTDQTPSELANLVNNTTISDTLEPETVEDVSSTSVPIFTKELIGAEDTETENSDIMKLVESIIEDMMNNTESNHDGEETKDIENNVEIIQKDNTQDYETLENEQESTNSEIIIDMEDDMRNEKPFYKNEPEENTEDFEIQEEVQEPITLNEITNMEEGINMDEAQTGTEISVDKDLLPTKENIDENEKLTTSAEELVTKKNQMAQKEPVNSNTIINMEEIIDNDDTLTTDYPEYTNKVGNDEEVLDEDDTKDKYSLAEELQTIVSKEIMFNKDLSDAGNIEQVTALTVDEPVSLEEVTIPDENMNIGLETNSEHLITSDVPSGTELVTNQEHLIPSNDSSDTEIVTNDEHLVPFDDYLDTELVTNMEHLIPSDDYSDNERVTNYEELIPSDDYLGTELRYEEEKVTSTNEHINAETYFEIKEVMTTTSPLYLEEATIEPIITTAREIYDKESLVTSTNMKEEHSTKMALDYQSTETPIRAEEQAIKEESMNDNEDMNMDKGDFLFGDNPVGSKDKVTNTGDYVKTEKYSVIEEVMTTISSMDLEEQTIEPLATIVKDSLVPSMNMKAEESTEIVLDSENSEMPIGTEEMTIGEGSANDNEGINMDIEDFLGEEYTTIEKESIMKETLEAAYDYLFKDYPIESEEKVSNTDEYFQIEEEITTSYPLYVEEPTIEPLATIRGGIDDTEVPSTNSKEEPSTQMILDSEKTEKTIVTEKQYIGEENLNDNNDTTFEDEILYTTNVDEILDTATENLVDERLDATTENLMKEILDTTTENLVDDRIGFTTDNLVDEGLETTISYETLETTTVDETLETTTVDEILYATIEEFVGERLETTTENFGDKSLDATSVNESPHITTENIAGEILDTTTENFVGEILETTTDNLVDESFDTTTVYESLDTTTVYEILETTTENLVDERLDTVNENIGDESLDTSTVHESVDTTTVDESLDAKTVDNDNVLLNGLADTTVSDITSMLEYATEGFSSETHSDTEETQSDLEQSHTNEFASISDPQDSSFSTDSNTIELSSTTETTIENESITLEHQKSTNEFFEALDVSEKLDEEFTWDDELLTDSLDYYSSETIPDHTEMPEDYPQYSETTMSNQLEDISESEYTDVEDDMFAETLMYDSGSFTDDSESLTDDSESFTDDSESYDDNSESFADNSESFADNSPLSMEESDKSPVENLKNRDSIETTTLKKQFVNEVIAEDTTKIEVKSTSDNLLISNPTSEEIVQESTTTKGI